jgi:hypothetical protein
LVIWIHISGKPLPSFLGTGTVVGATQDVDMHMFQTKGVIRGQVGVLNMEQFPYTTDQGGL